MLERPQQFEQIGRAQNFDESVDIDNAILEMFKDEKIPFFHLKAPSIQDDPFYVAVDVAFEYVQKRSKK